MDDLAGFLRPLFEAGAVRFEGQPPPALGPLEASRELLRARYERACLELAGPAPAFNERVAVGAAELLRKTCWALVDRSESPEVLARRLRPEFEAALPSDHFSADLTFRYLPGVYRRARAIDLRDPLAEIVAGLLRDWPLSGVLAGLDDGPTRPPDFGDQAGIAMMYAERFAARRKEAWMPAGLAREMLERVSAGVTTAPAGGIGHD
ncbi:MAG: hypothetical protein U0800_01590 [Isosphaeraceae bacterium]